MRRVRNVAHVEHKIRKGASQTMGWNIEGGKKKVGG